MDQANILEVRDIVKQYPGVRALDSVSLSIKRNTVHCIIGENGAGKSTLIKILTCAETMTSGEIMFDGEPYTAKSIKDAMNEGISTLFQELNIVDQLSVAENLVLGREVHVMGVLKKNREYPVYDMMREFAEDIHLDRQVETLGFAEKQIVEIVKAIGFNTKMVIMDEPTAALSEKESQRLYQVIGKLKEKGISIIYISHVLDDIYAVGDEVTVLRDGHVVGTKDVSSTSRSQLIEMMVGKVHTQQPPSWKIDWNDIVLDVKGLTTDFLKDVDFSLHRGEILGFYGLRGAGKSEIARALFGLDPWVSGEMSLHGRSVRIRSPEQAIRKLGISMVPEERLSEGLFMKMDVADNIVFSNLKKILRHLTINERLKRTIANHYISDLRIRAHGVAQIASTLSGGNQQKVVIAKCMNADTSILMMDEPTRGIDVGAKEEIYAIIRRLAMEGSSIMIFTSEYDEVASLCDNIALMSRGEIVSCVAREDLDPQKVREITMGV